MIDSYVGAQQPAVSVTLLGLASAGSATGLTLQTNQQNVYEKDYFKTCLVEIIGGTGEGQRTVCTGTLKSTTNARIYASFDR